MSDRPTDHLQPAAKKRGSDRQLTKDDGSSGSDEEGAAEPGTFARAPDAVLKARKIVRARRPGGGGGGSGDGGGNDNAGTVTANPFAGVSLVAAPPMPPPADGEGGSVNPFAALAEVQPPATATTATPPSLAEPAPADTKAPARTEDGAGEDEEAAAAPAAASAEPPAASAPPPPPATGGFGGFGAAAASGGFGGFAAAAAGGGFGAAAAAQATPAPALAGAAAAPPTLGSGGFAAFAAPPAPSPGGGGFPPVASIFGGGGGGSRRAGGGEGEGGGGVGDAPTDAFGAPAPLKPVAPPAVASLPPAAERVTGEEGETPAFSAEGVLFEFEGDPKSGGGAGGGWKERGRGELRLNLSDASASAPRARLVMRSRGHLRLLLNARLWAGMAAARMDGGKGATFAVVNAAGAPGDADPTAAPPAAAGAPPPAAGPSLSTYAFRVKTADKLDEFLAAIEAHKGAAA